MLSSFMPFALRSSRLVRLVFVAGAVLSAAVAGWAQSATPSAADGFDPNVDGNVYAVALQTDGKMIVAGQFGVMRPGVSGVASYSNHNNIARLNPDGSVDDTFDVNPNGAVRALLIQPDGKILIGGEFTTVQPRSVAAPVTRNRIARLNADGTLDTTFDPNVGGGFTPRVFALLLQPDNRIVVGGDFTSVQPNGTAKATTRNRLARFNADGTLDPVFDPNANNLVFALAQHGNGRIIVAGGFTSFQANGSAATTRNRIARLNLDGSLDPTFDPNLNNRALALAVQRDGKIIVGGDFTTVQPIGAENTSNRNNLVRLNADGTLDAAYNANASASVAAVAIQPDGRLIVGGNFNSVWGLGGSVTTRRFAARFNIDSSVDLTFDTGFNNNVTAFAFQADGQIVAVGTFTGLLPLGSSTSVVRNRVARLNPDGALDTTFNPDASGRILVSAVQPDGKILIGGSFTSVGGVLHNRLARLNADGSVDSAFAPDFNERVLAIKLQADGKILVGGVFSTVGGETRNNIARLNANGTLDTGFNPNANSIVGAIAVQSDGKIILGGQFTTLNPLNATVPVTRFNLARVNADGTVDTSFDPNANSTVAAIVVQSDGKILIGGQFTALNPNNTFTTDATTGLSTPTSDHTTTRNRIARLNADGTLDTSFVVSTDDQVSQIAIQPDGKIVIAGLFSSVVGYKATVTSNRLRLARLNVDGSVDATFDPSVNAPVATLALQSDGKILIGGPFTTLTPNGAAAFTVRRYAARVNTDGTLDPTFNLDLNEQNGNRVDSIAVQSDGKILIGGTFISLQPTGSTTRVARNHFARLTSAGGLDTAFQPAVGGFAGGQIKALAVQTDGKIVAAGAFTDIGGTTTTNIARFNATGTPDTNFALTLATDGAINALLVRPSTTATVQQGQGLAWLKSDGSVLTSFNPAADSRITGTVNVVARQPNGNILVGGSFTTPGGAHGSNLLRFSPTGVIDTTFAPNPNTTVSNVVVQSDGKILVGGGFTTITGITKNYFVRLNGDGTLDATFNPGLNGNVDAIAIQSDGKIVIGGGFLSLAPNNATSATTRNYLARLNAADGTLDTTFDPNFNGAVTSLAIQSDGKIIVGGAFTSLTPQTPTTTTTTVATIRNHIVRLNTDGTVDTTFDPNTNDAVNAVALQADGKVVVGGIFTTVQPNATTTAINRSRFARFNTDGTLDLTFDPKPNASVVTLSVQSDGKILVGGAFTTFQANGASIPTTRNHAARLNADGTVDGSFNPNANNVLYSFAALPDGTIVAGGAFTTIQPNGALLVGGAFANIGGIANRNLSLLTDDGSVSSGFQPLPNGAVNALVAQPDGKFVVAGAFTSISGATRNRVARYNADNTLDAAFSPAVNDTVNVVALQSDGKIVIGGAFTTVGGQARSTIARLNADGTLDTTFSSSLFAGVSGLAVQPDGRILVLGSGSGVPTRLLRLNADGSQDSTFLTAVLSAPIATLALQTDGKIVIGGSWQLGAIAIFPGPFSPSYLARLNANGTFDPTFAPGPDGAVSALALQSDGRLLVGGAFGSMGGLVRGGLARLSATTAATQVIGASRNTLVWTRSGSGPELAGVTFEQSPDGQTWTTLGQATRASGTSSWQLGGLSLPTSGLFYIRARGLVPSSSGTSAGAVEMVREFNLAPSPGVGPAGTAGAIAAAGFTIDRLTGLITGAPSGATGGTPPVAKVSGAATEVLSDIYLPTSGNTYDQVLLTGASATITADPGQVTRLSYLDLSNDIVQVEFSGAGSLSIVLDNPAGPVAASNYNQAGVTYMKGHAGIVIAGADETSNVSIYSVGRFTAINQGLFRDGVSYDGVADLAYLTIVSSNGKFGGVRTANASYFASQGITGIRAIGVQFSGPVYVGDVSASDTATPMLLFGSAGDVRITGGDLFQANGQPVQVSGITQLRFVDGTTSGGMLLPAQADRSHLIQNGADVTSQLVVNPTP